MTARTRGQRKADAEARLAALEAQIDDVLMSMAIDFFVGVLDDAIEALDAPVLLASGRVRDPFAWTSVRSRWYSAVRTLADEAATVVPARVIDLLMQSDLPYTAYLRVSETLATSVTEGWTVHKTKRELSRLLITKRGKGEDLSPYRSRVRMIARTSATLNFNADELSALVDQGYLRKEWVTQHDTRVRDSHVSADGQVVNVLDPFVVGGHLLMVPGDPSAPLDLTANCRCYVIGSGPVSPSGEDVDADPEALPDDEYDDAFDFREDVATLNASQIHADAPGGTMSRTTLRAVRTEAGVAFRAAASPDALTAAADPADYALWEGVIGTEGTLTGDGRLIEENALRWDLPAPLRYVREDVGAHDGAEVAGRILTIERRENGDLFATGDFYLGSEAGRAAHRAVGAEVGNGVSMDLDDVTFEVRIAADVLEEMNEMLAEDSPQIEAEDTPPETDADGRVTVATRRADDEVYVTTSARVRAATIVSIPAFANAIIRLSDTADVEPLPDEPAEAPADAALVASGGPVRPPAAWFADPALDGPTALVVEDDGRVYGHIALWGTCHTSHTAQGQCIQPPASATGYAHFRTGALRTEEGTEVPVGHLTLDTRHAGPRLSAAAAARHYDDTGSVAADVAAGEDAFGIWVAGSLRPGISDEDVRALRAAPISGDWRRLGGNLELVAALAVNTPGFPVPRPQGLVASGAVYSLTASGMVAPGVETTGGEVRVPDAADVSEGLSPSDLRYLRALAERERAYAVEALSERVAASKIRIKAAAFAATLRGGK